MPRKIGTDVADLLAAEIDPAEWLVPGYLTENSINVLAGPPNSGKTLLAFDWAAQLVKRGKKVFVGENEGGLRGLQDRVRRACVAAGMPSPPPGQFMYERNMDIRMGDFGAVKALGKALEFFDLIILDSLSSFWPGLNENDAEQMSLVAEGLKILCEFSRAAVLGNHHTTKAAWKAGEKPGLGDLRGHGSMVGRIDAAFICKPMERVAGEVRFELHVVKQRDEDWTPPKEVSVLMTGDAATVTSQPMQQRGRSMARPTDARELELEAQVMSALPEDENQAISRSAVCTTVRKAKPDVIAAIKRLYYAGRIQQEWNGRYYRSKAQHAQPSANGAASRYTPSYHRPYQPPGDID